MNWWMGLLEGLREIRAHKFRSALTMLGIVLGVASLMAMFALTAGMAAGFQETLSQVGGLERIGIVDSPVPPEQELIKEMSPGRTYRDAQAIREAGTLFSFVSPEMEMHARMEVGPNASNVRLLGVEEDFLEIERHQVEHGRSLAELDGERFARVCVIGQGIWDELWPERETPPLGERIVIQGQPFRVAGVFQRYETEKQRKLRELGITQKMEDRQRARTGSAGGGKRGRNNPAGWWDPLRLKNNSVIIPLATFQRCFRSANVQNEEDQGPDLKLTRLNVQLADLSRFDEGLEQLRHILALTHRGVMDFGFDTREAWFESATRSIGAARLSGGIIAGISLVVGGIGITNIMLASISERVREIGIRRAVGARARDVFIQILAESIVLATLGAGVGLAFSGVLMKVLAAVAPSENAPIVEVKAILISVGFALAVGILAGVYPAWKASKLHPIQALRYE
jgi:putative ABC transport system permease protein